MPEILISPSGGQLQQTGSKKPLRRSVDNALPTKNRREARAEVQRIETSNSELLALFQEHAFEQHFQPNSTLLLHGDPADAIYLVVSGTVRCCTIDSSGRRQIFSFPKKSSLVGLSDMDYWHFTAEAVDHVIVKSMPRSVLEQALATNMTLRQEVRAHVRGLLAERERQLLTLATNKGPDRLCRFLEDFATKRNTTGFVVLPMCRRDIADHIGLSTEGVSRAFTTLKRKGLIELKSCERYRMAFQALPHPSSGPIPAHV